MSGVPWLLVDITVFSTSPARAFSDIVRGVLPQEGSSYKGVAADSASVDQACLLQSFPNGLFRFFCEPISCFPLGANTTTVSISAQSDGETSVLGRLVILMDVPLLLMLSGSSLLEASGIKSGFDFPCSSLLSLPLLRLNFHIIAYFCLSEIQQCPPTNEDRSRKRASDYFSAWKIAFFCIFRCIQGIMPLSLFYYLKIPKHPLKYSWASLPLWSLQPPNKSLLKALYIS